MKRVRVWVVGCGTVGQWLVRALDDNRTSIEERYGLSFELVGLANLRNGFVYRKDGIGLQSAVKSSDHAVARDEIRERAVRHLSPGGPAQPPPGQPSPGGGWFDDSDPVARATIAAAADLAAQGAAGKKVRERQLALALGSHLEDSVVERRLKIPEWDPQPGNVDVFTTDWLGNPKLVVETKLKSDNSIFECLWDMAKVLSLLSVGSVEAAYLVTGTTIRNWKQPVACAELFVTGRHDLVGAIERYAGWWDKYILGDSTGRPLYVSRYIDVEVVAAAEYELDGVAWELRAIKVNSPTDSPRVPFLAGRPRPS